MNIEFRKSEISDAEEIILVKANAFKEEVKMYGHGPNEKDSVEKERAFIRNIDGNNFSYILLDDGKIIGGIGGVDKGNGNFYLGCIYVALEYQSKGVGSMIMKFLDDKFPNAITWTLETPYLSYRNHHFYEKHGFVKVGQTKPRDDGFFLFLYERTR
ncbi:GNAT family N-acetyltransferase [Inconstantimicrobium mannanitabidum]|uniref:Uncharacterized protein n=1 Tax=Inconstantimicrobium mannanitabidum TaxID=1604901 RepID=A0ACB5RI72_9CLOT|nr:GNAT family N-acetyltransferase [Clostridium sp. TW13]GKX68781.1 hypothetical protein rsdtw13_40390 [Clostridium sp. TW13]